MNNIIEYNVNIFESIKHIDDNGNEYWSARELLKTLGYNEYRYFKPAIEKAIISCINSNINALEHFVQVHDMVNIGSKAQRKVDNYHLSRYACYLIVQNADPRKESVAIGKTYFAIQTRIQELTTDEYNKLSEEEKRLYKRSKTRNGNYTLNKTAIKCGVKNLARFHNAGYKGLYNGETADDIAKRKNLRYREDILDNMCSEELAANEFRIAQTEAKLKRDAVNNEYQADAVHFEVGKEIRETIKRLGGTMPEDLPTPEKSLKEYNKDYKKLK